MVYRDRTHIEVTSDMKAEVIIDEKTIHKLNECIHKNPYKETGMYLIGNTCKDSITGVPIILITDVYSEERQGTASNFEFTTDYQINAVKYVKKNHSGAHIIGNAHSHAQFPAFWSSVDDEMMLQARENCIYFVISPRYGTYKARFKDSDFNFFDCNIRVVGENHFDTVIRKSVSTTNKRYVAGGRPVNQITYSVNQNYTEVQEHEMSKRYLHSVDDLKDKRVLVVGAGNIGNLIIMLLIESGISNLTIVDMDTHEYWNGPRACMLTDTSCGKPKALELARKAAEKASYSIEVTGIATDITTLGWGFFDDFDIVISPVDSIAIRQYIDRGCKLKHIPHITCGTGTVEQEYTGNVLLFPSEAVVDLEYVWGTRYREKLEERLGCSDTPEETQAQLMSFSSQIAGMTCDLAIKTLLDEMENDYTVRKYVLNAIGNGYEHDKVALRAYKYSKPRNAKESELYRVFERDKDIPYLEFDRTKPKSELFSKLKELFRVDTSAFQLNLEWSLIIPVAYRSTGACPSIVVFEGCGVDDTLKELPDEHIYLVEADETEHLIDLKLVDQ